jgi:hypothetical protein
VELCARGDPRQDLVEADRVLGQRVLAPCHEVLPEQHQVQPLAGVLELRLQVHRVEEIVHALEPLLQRVLLDRLVAGDLGPHQDLPGKLIAPLGPGALDLRRGVVRGRAPQGRRQPN